MEAELDCGLAVRPCREAMGPDRARLRTPYYQRLDAHANESTKQPQRDAVIEHFSEYHKPGKAVRYLGFPGMYWTFEHQLDRAMKCEHFTGIEWNWQTFRDGLVYMPGGKVSTWPIETNAGSLVCTESDRANVIYGHAGTFLSIGRKEKQCSRSVKRRFAKRFKTNTAVWLDLNTNLSKEAEMCLRHIGHYCCLDTECVPFAFTFVLGRDRTFTGDGNGVERRLPWIKTTIAENGWRALEVTQAYSYQSEANAAMGMVLGTLLKINRLSERTKTAKATER